MNKKILFVASEVMPFAATGGLGDVLGSLPKAIKAACPQSDIRVIMPLYDTIDTSIKNCMSHVCSFNVQLAWRNLYCGIKSLEKDGVTYYFVDNEYYFKRSSLYGCYDDGERFAYFCAATMQALHPLGFCPDIIHAHDWQSALCIVYLKRKYGFFKEFANTKGIFTIHNIEYQGKYGVEILSDIFDLQEHNKDILYYDNCLNLMKGAIVCADKVTTVSPTYANEIQTAEYAQGLEHILIQSSHKLCGILNGIDYDYYNPQNDRSVFCNYSSQSISKKVQNKLMLQQMLSLPQSSNIPLIAVISRLVHHKGIELITNAIQGLINEDIQFIIIGRGNTNYESFFQAFEQQHYHKARAILNYDRELSKKLYAAADIFLMPSQSEPCGLSQMIASRYGAVPVTRETGGLSDSIRGYYEKDGEILGNGFTFKNYSCDELYERVMAALGLYKDTKKWNTFVKKIMETDFSWHKSAAQYIDLYQNL